MKGGKRYKEIQYIGYNEYYYFYENGICLDIKRNIILIPEEEIPLKNQNKEENVSKSIIKSSGLYNYGHNCFINAFLQCLINCEPLTNYFLTNYKKSYYNNLSNIYLDFIKKYQQKDCYAAKGIINFFFSRDSSIKHTGSDSKDVLIEFFDQIQSELKQADESIIMDDSTNPENEKDVLEERIKLDNADYSIINKCFNFWIESKQKCNNRHCPKYDKNLYEIRSESYFIFYLIEIYNYYNLSRKKNGYKNKLSLEDCFLFYLLEKGNCSYCQKPIEIKNKICKLPNILVIVLNRGINNQYNINIDFNQELNLDKCYQKLQYNNNGLDQDAFPKYNLLCGTILEKDYYNPGKGHTIAFATDNNEKYIIYNDNKILNNVGFENIKNKDVYILFYQINKNNNKTSGLNNSKNYKRC